MHDSALTHALLTELKYRLEQAVDRDALEVGDGISREEYVDGMMVHTAWKKGWRVPLDLIGLKEPCR